MKLLMPVSYKQSPFRMYFCLLVSLSLVVCFILLGRIAALRTQTRPIVTQWSVGLPAGLSVTLVSPAKTAAPIEMLFGLRTWVGPRKHCITWGLDPPWEWGILRGKWATHCKVQGHSAVICAKTAQPIEIPFSLGASMGRRNRVLEGV